MHEKLIAVLIGLALLIGGGAAETDMTNAQPVKVKKQVTGVEKKQDSLQAETAQTAKYPPYPDVWGYEFEFPGPNERKTRMKIYEMQNGDYKIAYIKNWNRKARTLKLALCSFFSGVKKDFKSNEYERFEKKYKQSRVGEHATVSDNEFYWRQSADCLGSCCPQFSMHFIEKVSNKTGKVVDSRNIIYVTEEPLKIYDGTLKKCAGKNGWAQTQGDFYNARVFEVYPMFVSLQDGTFLLYDGLGNFIIRFDKNLHSKSDLLNKKVFVVNRKDIKAIEDRLLKKKDFNEQTYRDAIFEYLKSQKKRG